MYKRTPVTLRHTWYTKGSMRGGVPRIYYGWMKPGSTTRTRFEKMRNPFVDLDSGTPSIYYRDTRDPKEAVAAEADAKGIKGADSAIDLYDEYKIVPDLYPEGFQWKHKLNSEYNQWRSNTWVTPDLIPPEHRGRFLCNFHVNVGEFTMQVAKFSPKDHRQWIYCCLYVGSGKGIAGWGRAIAPSSQEAKKEAIRNAFANIIAVDLETEGPMYPVRLNVDGMRVLMYPAPRIVANFVVADILCAFGLQHCGVKLHAQARQRPRNITKIYNATFEVVRVHRSVNEIAHARGKIPHSLINNIYPYLEEIRRRKGLMAMQPRHRAGRAAAAGEGGDGDDAAVEDSDDGLMFMPDRVVDNTMPDHLKKGYYDDTYWRDFFAGSKAHLSEPKLGLRGDQLRERAAASNRVGMTPGGKGPSTAGRRATLATVLGRMGKSVDSIGALPVSNPYADTRLITQAKSAFHLH